MVLTWREKDWVGCHQALEPDRIEQVEHELGVQFPPDYRDCIRTCHGGHPRTNAFWLDDPVIGRMGSSLGALLSFSEEDTENIVETNRALHPYLPSGTIAIADDGGGDFVCFRYGELEEPPTIVYWPHGEVDVIPLASSFSEFIDKLTEE